MVAASVFLPSYNKSAYIMDAINSVLAQTSDDWELWILENSTDGKTRKVIKQSGILDDPRIIYAELDLSDQLRNSCYPTAFLLNRAYPLANGEYIFYLSDDDLLMPECVETCVSYLNEHPAEGVCYFSLQTYGVPDPALPPVRLHTIVADIVRGPGNVDSAIDGGQIVHRKSCLDKLEQPFFAESANPNDARHVDGLFMKSLAYHYSFCPIGQILGIHRFTPVSQWSTYVRGMIKVYMPSPALTTIDVECARCGEYTGELSIIT